MSASMTIACVSHRQAGRLSSALPSQTFVRGQRRSGKPHAVWGSRSARTSNVAPWRQLSLQSRDNQNAVARIVVVTTTESKTAAKIRVRDYLK